MKVRSLLLWMVMGVFAAFGLYAVKYRVQALKVEVAANETQLREEKKNLHVLTAEWTYLNRPERLRVLASKYLDDSPVQGKQLADFASLPVNAAALTADPRRTPLARGMTLASGALHGR